MADEFRTRNAKTGMWLADRVVPRSEMHGAKSNGASMHYRWVWKREDAKVFTRIPDAELPLIFLNCQQNGQVVNANDEPVSGDNWA